MTSRPAHEHIAALLLGDGHELGYSSLLPFPAKWRQANQQYPIRCVVWTRATPPGSNDFFIGSLDQDRTLRGNLENGLGENGG
jgi:hypothetical protein